MFWLPESRLKQVLSVSFQRLIRFDFLFQPTSGEQVGEVGLRAAETRLSAHVIAGQLQVLGCALLEGTHNPAPLLQTVVLLQKS